MHPVYAAISEQILREPASKAVMHSSVIQPGLNRFFTGLALDRGFYRDTEISMWYNQNDVQTHYEFDFVNREGVGNGSERIRQSGRQYILQEYVYADLRRY